MTEQARAVRRFVERRQSRRAQRAGGYVVAAGKGGVGTSTAALLLALAARRDGPVALVDAQHGLAGLDRMLRLYRPPEDGTGVHSAEVARNLRLVFDDAGDEVMRASARRAALRRAARREDGATIVVDAGAHPPTVMDSLTDFGGSLVTVVAPDGASAPAAYALAKLAWRQRPEMAVAALGNRTGDEEGPLIEEALRSAALRFADRSVRWLGSLPDAPLLAGLEPPEWSTIAQDAPRLWNAAGRAWNRLRTTGPHASNPTLTLWD